MRSAAAIAKRLGPALLMFLAGAASAQTAPQPAAAPPRAVATAPAPATLPPPTPSLAAPSVTLKSGATPPTATSTPTPSTAPAAASVTPLESVGDGKRTTIVDVKGHDLSPWSMFLAADIVVKTVICGLLLASFATWTVLFAKSLELVLAMRRLREGLRHIGEARTLRQACELCDRDGGPSCRLLAAAVLEERLSVEADAVDRAGIKARAASAFADVTRIETRAMRRGMGFLATVGSTSPFVGLFGTVWGIMNSFIGISNAQTTNLAVVAPGIAEALLATAIGLFAAIPAVVIYNHFSRRTRSYLSLVAQAAGLVERLLSRDLDRVRGPARSLAAE